MSLKKWHSAAIAALFAVGTVGAVATPAMAQHRHHAGSYHHRGSYHGHYSGGHGYPRYARGYHHGPRHWYYHGGYRYYGYGWGYDPWGAVAAAGVVGLAAGAIAAGAVQATDSVAYCEQRYRSYDPRTGTYLGYDGYRHPCP
jgi:hypothetical protein